MIDNFVLIVNSSTTPLVGAATFTGVWQDVSQWNSIVLASKSDVAGTLYADFSIDGITTDSTLTFQTSANSPEQHRLTIARQYFRVRYTNGAASQTTFRLQCIAGTQQMLSSPLNGTVGLDNDSIMTRSLPSFLEFSRGLFNGVSKTNKAGRNLDVDTGTVPEWVWDNGGVYTGFPTGAAETITVVSDSADDSAGGAGARTLQITGLDANYDMRTEIVTLNGLGGVTTTGTFSRVHTASVLTSGSSNQAFNVGILTVRHTTTVANVFLSILPGANQSYACVYTVPAGKTGTLVNVNIEIDRSASANIAGALWVREFGASPRYRRNFSASNTSPFFQEPYGGLAFPEKTDIGVVVLACSANNTATYAEFDIVVIDA